MAFLKYPISYIKLQKSLAGGQPATNRVVLLVSYDVF